MNKTLDKVVHSLAKPIGAALLAGALTVAAYTADAQTYVHSKEEYAKWDKPTTSYIINVVVEEELTESLSIKEKDDYGRWSRSKSKEQHLDILKVYYPTSQSYVSLVYPGDLSWSEGDRLRLRVDVNKDGTTIWYDHKLTESYLKGRDCFVANPGNKRFHTGVITEVLDKKPALKK